jgi:DNA-binding SARP family transcriptional activator
MEDATQRHSDLTPGTTYSSLMVPSPAPSRRAAVAAPPDGRTRLLVLGDFHVRHAGQDVRLAGPARRVVAYLAVHGGGPLPRQVVAETLWAERGPSGASANLRQALAWERRHGCRLIGSDWETLWLQPAVQVDLQAALAAARRLFEVPDDADVDPSPFLSDLLPAWDEEWLASERESFQQLRLRCLEDLGLRWLRLGRSAPAVAAARAVLAVDSLRESALRLLIEAHLAEGNRAQALLKYRDYEAELDRELGLSPSSELGALVGR